MVHAHDGQPPAPLRKMLSTAVGAAVRQEEEALLAVAIAEGEAGGGSGDGDGCDIESGVAAAAAKLAAAKLAAAKEANRFTGEPRQLISGKPEDAALGVNHYMRVTDVQVNRAPKRNGSVMLNKLNDGNIFVCNKPKDSNIV
eukprot:1419536-Pleurochrysis_carterae.AAC.1